MCSGLAREDQAEILLRFTRRNDSHIYAKARLVSDLSMHY